MSVLRKALRALGLAAITTVYGSAAMASAHLGAREPLTTATVQSLIAEQLDQDGLVGEWAIRVHAPRLPMPNHSDETAELLLSVRSYNSSTGRLRADLDVLFEDGRTHRLGISALVDELVAVPVPVVMIDAGEIIEDGHVKLARVRSQSLGQSRITELDDLIGKQARRRLIADRPVARRDLRHPEDVETGDLVTIVYRNRGLALHISGRALDTGSTGDSVRARNENSDRVVRGTVEGPGVIRVGNLAREKSVVSP